MPQTLPFLDFKADGFSTRSTEVIQARKTHWCARTPYGLAVLRHKQAGQLLRDRRLRQGSYAWTLRNDLKGCFADFWARSVISQEGPPHRAQRDLMVRALSDDFVEGLKPQFVQAAQQLADPLSAKTTCEFMAEFSIPFAGMANCALLGLPFEHWPQVSADASALGLAMGIECKSHEATFNAACVRLMDLAADLVARARAKQNNRGYVDRLVKLFDQSDHMDEQTLLDMIVISIFGGVDTTKAQLGFLICLFADHPDQWHHLRTDPALALNAINEAIRNRPTTTWATREAVTDFTFEGVDIVRGTTVHILSHATGTDPAIHHPAKFDITRKRKIHFGFGGGAHHCIGHYLAKTDMGVALQVLAKTWAEFTLANPPVFLPDSGNTSPVSIELEYTLA